MQSWCGLMECQVAGELFGTVSAEAAVGVLGETGQHLDLL